MIDVIWIAIGVGCWVAVVMIVLGCCVMAARGDGRFDR